jgi:hypothetical protein
MSRGARFKKFDQANGVLVAGENLGAKLGHHLGDGEGFVLQVDADDLFAALQDLLEDFDEVNERDDEVAFGAFVVIKRFVGPGPNVFLDLLLLIEQLSGVFEFFVFDEALDELGARVGGLLLGARAGGASST